MNMDETLDDIEPLLGFYRLCDKCNGFVDYHSCNSLCDECIKQLDKD